MSASPLPVANAAKLAEIASQLWSLGRDGAWDEVARLSTCLRTDYPSHPVGYVRGASALRQLQRYDEADAVILEALERFPDDPQALVEAAMTAQARGDGNKAVHWSSLLVQRFPSHAAGYRIRIHAHRGMRQFAEAEAVVADGMRTCPDDVGIQVEGCWVAMGQENWALALERSDALRRMHPTVDAGYRIALGVLKRLKRWSEVGPLLAAAQANLESASWIRTESLRLAQHEGPEKALDLAMRIIDSDPCEVVAYEVGASALRNLGRIDEAEQLLQRAIESLAPDPQILSEHAWLAQDRGNWAQVDERWAEARRRFPEDRQIALWYARSGVLPFRPYEKADVLETHRRYNDLHDRFPDLGAAYADHIQMFRNANCPAEAEEVARAACEKIPDDARIRVEYSQAAAGRGDHDSALARLVEVQDRFADNVGFQCRLVAALAAVGRVEEAEEACRGLVARHRDWELPFIEYAELAMRRHDWRAAVDRWKEANRAFPDHARIKKGLFDAEYANIEIEHHVPGRIPVDDRPSAADAADGQRPMQEILLRFESLAGTFQGCEFGAVQRYFGCEPLGLFRWGQIDIEDIILAIESQLDGMGTPEQMELVVPKYEGEGFNETNAEYVVGDLRYRMKSHTFIRAIDMPYDKMYGQSLRRLQFLKRKLLEDLAESQKIFVYKRGHAIILKEQGLRLARAVCAYSPTNQVLCVHLATREGQAGTVERVSPNLMFGYVSHFTLAPGRKETTRRPAYSEWESLCRKAYDLWQFGRGQSA